MAEQDWVAAFPQSDQPAWTGAGTALSTAATATISAMPTGATPDFNKYVNGSDWTVGKNIRGHARGFITTTATGTTATWFLASNIDNTGTTYVTWATTPGIATLASAVTGLPWELWFTARCIATASAGNTIATQGLMKIATTVAPAMTAASGIIVGLPNASGETQAAVNTTRTQGIALRATLAAANATIQCTQWFLETMN
jgi:hypothetical protein